MTSEHPARRLDSNFLALATDSKNTAGDADMTATGASSWPSVIFKCNHGDFFSRFKQEMEHHIELMHPSEEVDYISIPANAVALQAFQEAIAGATATACPDRSKSLDAQGVSTGNDNDCPVAVKEEPRKVGPGGDEEEDHVHVANTALFHLDKTSVAPGDSAPKSESVQCPLCQDTFTEKNILEMHLMEVHSVSPHGLARLLQLVDNSSWHMQVLTTNNINNIEVLTEESPHAVTAQVAHLRRKPDMSLMEAITDETEMQCQQCSATFKLQQHLLMHAQESQHYAMQNGEYQCLARKQCGLLFSTSAAMVAHFQDSHMNLIISERHVYKYRCKQCSLAFKTQEKLATHTLYHTMRDATKCDLCPRNFRSMQSLQKHIDQVHSSCPRRQSEHEQSSTYGANHIPLPNSSDLVSQTVDITRDTTVMDRSDTKESRPQSLQIEADSNTQAVPLPGQLVFSPVSGKASEEPRGYTSPSHPNASNTAPSSAIDPASNQQQHFAAITALLKQKHQTYQSTEDENNFSADIPQQLQIESGILAHKIMEKNFHQSVNHFPNLTPENLQPLQNLQNLRHIPQIAAAVAASASGPSMNPVDVLNFMQFQQLMSLSFMNLAPPLIFGCARAETSALSNAQITSAALRGNVLNSSTGSSVAGTSTTTIKGAPEVSSNECVQHMQQPSSPIPATVSQVSNSQKRARTRITDDQLKILRAHFDINNSPSEESIMEMSKKANLPMKVVKHWFRNTLFKERQRNKDSPYNFNNPPSTTLNFEEYERTGQARVTPLGDESSATKASFSNIDNEMQQNPPTAALQHTLPNPVIPSNTGELSNQGHLSFPQQQLEEHHQSSERSCPHESVASGSCQIDDRIKSEPRDEASDTNCTQQQQLLTPTSEMLLKQHHQLAKITAAAAANEQHMSELNEHTAIHAAAAVAAASAHRNQQFHTFYSSYETKSESGSSDIHSRPQTPNSSSATNPYSSMSEMLGQQLDNMPLSNMSNLNNMGPPKKLQINKVFEKNSPSQFETNSNSSNSSSTSSGKRANRTRFTDYQIKVLQEFFENNSYPKDSDLEYLSKLLLLSPRVIVVWFQNARQKQRKIYENQPNNSFNETEEKKQNINYACKKCNLVFQRYYELIRHQKNHCFKEENNKKSAKAQIAAAQIAQSLSSEDSNSSIDINNASAIHLLTGPKQQHIAAVAAAAALVTGSATPGLSPSPSLNMFATSPQHLLGKASSTTDCSPSTTPTPPQRERRSSVDLQEQKYECEKCSCTFQRYELFREHQLIHIMNPNLFGQTQQLQRQQAAQQNLADGTVATYSPFGGILHSIAQNNASAPAAKENYQQQKYERSMDLSRSLRKRKVSSSSDANEDPDDVSLAGENEGMQGSKKFKSDQYGFLYQYFLQNESNLELKSELEAKQQQSSSMDLEYLVNYYQQTEMKKRNNYDFLFQYYIRNEQPFKQQALSYDATDKQNMNFLLQYYQLNESKKFFQLEASSQRIHDCNKATSTSGQINSSEHHIDMGIHSDNSNDTNRNDSNDIGDHINDSNDEDDTGHENEITTHANCDVTESTNLLQHNNMNCMSNSNCSSAAYKDRDVHAAGMGYCSESFENNKTKGVHSEWLHMESEVNRNILKEDYKLNDTIPLTSASPQDTAKSSQAPYQPQYKHLEDFLDATMIENHTQTLTFNDVLVDVSTTALNATSATTTTSNTSTTTAADHRQNKRLRTTILPEQLNFLYECYQNESNPSRKMLEEISKKVNLKKRVVQVSNKHNNILGCGTAESQI